MHCQNYNRFVWAQPLAESNLETSERHFGKLDLLEGGAIYAHEYVEIFGKAESLRSSRSMMAFYSGHYVLSAFTQNGVLVFTGSPGSETSRSVVTITTRMHRYIKIEF